VWSCGRQQLKQPSPAATPHTAATDKHNPGGGMYIKGTCWERVRDARFVRVQAPPGELIRHLLPRFELHGIVGGELHPERMLRPSRADCLPQLPDTQPCGYIVPDTQPCGYIHSWSVCNLNPMCANEHCGSVPPRTLPVGSRLVGVSTWRTGLAIPSARREAGDWTRQRGVSRCAVLGRDEGLEASESFLGPPAPWAPGVLSGNPPMGSKKPPIPPCTIAQLQPIRERALNDSQEQQSRVAPPVFF